MIHRLPQAISIAHACLGPTFFCLVVCLAEILAPARHCESLASTKSMTRAKQSPGLEIASSSAKVLWRTPRNDSSDSGLAITAGATAVLVFLQILLGAVVRHTGEGVGFHVVLAFLMLLMAGALVRRALIDFAGEPLIQRPSLFLSLLVFLEFFLGIGAFVFTRVQGLPEGIGAVLFPTLHQTLGALLLATAALITVRSALKSSPVC